MPSYVSGVDSEKDGHSFSQSVIHSLSQHLLSVGLSLRVRAGLLLLSSASNTPSPYKTASCEVGLQ